MTSKSKQQSPKTPERPGNRSKWASHVQPRLASIRAWKAKGLIDSEIANNLGISRKTLIEYKNAHSDLRDILKSGKEDAIAQVENALMKRALGYEYEEVKTIEEKLPDGKTVKEVRVEKTIKFQPPDVTAQIFFLTNRASDRWRHKNVLEHAGLDGQPLLPGTMTFYLPEKQPVTPTKGTNDK